MSSYWVAYSTPASEEIVINFYDAAEIAESEAANILQIMQGVFTDKTPVYGDRQFHFHGNLGHLASAFWGNLNEKGQRFPETMRFLLNTYHA